MIARLHNPSRHDARTGAADANSTVRRRALLRGFAKIVVIRHRLPTRYRRRIPPGTASSPGSLRSDTTAISVKLDPPATAPRAFVTGSTRAGTCSPAESLAGQRAQVPNRQHRILEVVHQSEAQHQIEDSEPRDVRILDISLTKRYPETVSRLHRDSPAPIESAGSTDRIRCSACCESPRRIPHPAHSRGFGWASIHYRAPNRCCPAPESVANTAYCRKR